MIKAEGQSVATSAFDITSAFPYSVFGVFDIQSTRDRLPFLLHLLLELSKLLLNLIHLLTGFQLPQLVIGLELLRSRTMAERLVDLARSRCQILGAIDVFLGPLESAEGAIGSA